MANPKDKPDIDADLVKKLAGLLDETGLTEIEFGTGAWHLRVSKAARPMIAQAIAPSGDAHGFAGPAASPATPAAAESHPGTVKSPMVGVAYTQADPDSPPMVKVGDVVEVGQTLLLIEAMKVFNPIKAPPGRNGHADLRQQTATPWNTANR